MRRLLPMFLALFAGKAFAVDITMEFCGSVGVSYPENGCPCDIESVTAGPNVGETTADAAVTISGDNCAGVLHVCLEPDADGDPTRSNCINNVGITDKQTDAVAGPGTSNFTGASTLTGAGETLYQVHAFLVPSGNYQNRVTFDSGASANFTTNAAPGGGGTDLTGAGLFIAKADGGNTDETPTGNAGTETSGCTSMAASCSEFSHIGTPASGTNVYLAEGGVWEDDELNISWSGTSGDRVVIGCYFDEGDDDGNPVLCTSF